MAVRFQGAIGDVAGLFLQFDARPLGVPPLCPDGRTRRHPGGCRCASRGRLLMSGDNSFSSTQGLWASRHCARTVERHHPGGWRCAFQGACFFCRRIVSSVRRKQGLWASRHCARTAEHATTRAGAGALPRRLLMSEDCFFSSTQGLWASRHCARTAEHATTRPGAGALPRDEFLCRRIVLQFCARPLGVPSLCPGGRTPPPGRVPVRFQGAIVDVGGLFLQFDARPLGVPSLCPDGRTPPPGRVPVRFQGAIVDVGGLFLQFDARPLGVPSLCPDGRTRRHPGGCRCASKGRLLMSEDCSFSSTQGLWASRHCARTVEHSATRAGAGALPWDDC